MPDYPALIKGIRGAMGLTQEELARSLHVTFGTINGWENGKHKPIPALGYRLLELARQAGVSPSTEGGSALPGSGDEE